MDTERCVFLGTGSLGSAEALNTPLVAEVFKGEAHFKILASQKLDHFLKVVAFFSRHTNLAVLKGALHLEVLRLDGLGDLLGIAQKPRRPRPWGELVRVRVVIAIWAGCFWAGKTSSGALYQIYG